MLGNKSQHRRPEEARLSTGQVTPAADQRRDQMLEAAAALIAERGFSETRITDVARRAGASPALVVYYFGTKDQLLTEALRWSETSFYDMADRMLDETPGVQERLERIMQMTFVAEEGDSSSWGMWFDLWAQAFRHPQVSKDRLELDNRWRAVLVRIVEDGIAAGEVDEVDARAFAVAWSALLDGLSIQVALEDPEVSPEQALAIAMDFASQRLGLPSSRGR